MPKELRRQSATPSSSVKNHAVPRRSHLSLIGKRIAALLVDWLLATLAFACILWAVSGTESFQTGEGAYQITIPATLYAIYLLGSWLWKGTTPGLLLLGLRVIDLESRGTPRPWQWWLRGLGLLVAALPFGIGLLWALWDPRAMAWHDHIAGTQVIDAQITAR